MLRPKDILEKRYIILGPDPLGQGGMGKVWKAKDKKTGSIVAVKEFELNPHYKLSVNEKKELQDLFLKESELLAGLEHNAFPRVRDKCSYKEIPCIVMDFISGDDFTKLLRERKDVPFDFTQLFDWMDQILDALNYLHSLPNPIIHKDIKPGNLKLTQNNQIKVLDFGIAKGSIGEMTLPQNSIPLGTLRYAPLEQALKTSQEYRNILAKTHKDKVESYLEQHTCPQSDIFSLCATTYRLLAGKLPENFDAPSRALYLWDNKIDPLPDLNEINPKVPRKLSDLIRKGMNLEIENRIESAATMRNLLLEIREDEQNREKKIEQKNLEDSLKNDFEKKLAVLHQKIENQTEELNRYINEKQHRGEEVERFVAEKKRQSEYFEEQIENYKRQNADLQHSLQQLEKKSVNSETFNEIQQSAYLLESKLKKINNNYPKLREKIIKETITVFVKGIFGSIDNKSVVISNEFSDLEFFNSELESVTNKIKAEFKNNSGFQFKQNEEQKKVGRSPQETILIASLFTIILPIPVIIAIYLGWATTTFNTFLGEKLFLLIVIVPLITLTVPCCTILILFFGEKLFGIIKEIKYKPFMKYIRRLGFLVIICGISGAIIGMLSDILFNVAIIGIIKGNIIGIILAYMIFYFLFYRDLMKKEQ